MGSGPAWAHGRCLPAAGGRFPRGCPRLGEGLSARLVGIRKRHGSDLSSAPTPVRVRRTQPSEHRLPWRPARPGPRSDSNLLGARGRTLGAATAGPPRATPVSRASPLPGSGRLTRADLDAAASGQPRRAVAATAAGPAQQGLRLRLGFRHPVARTRDPTLRNKPQERPAPLRRRRDPRPRRSGRGAHGTVTQGIPALPANDNRANCVGRSLKGPAPLGWSSASFHPGRGSALGLKGPVLGRKYVLKGLS